MVTASLRACSCLSVNYPTRMLLLPSPFHEGLGSSRQEPEPLVLTALSPRVAVLREVSWAVYMRIGLCLCLLGCLHLGVSMFIADV